MISEKVIYVRKAARFCSIGKLDGNIKKLWLVFHGYGQLAKDFIKSFELIVNETTVVIAPEALNKFYVKGFADKVGATWMTKEDRENEINDYINMIDNICKEISKSIDLSIIQINVLGFSQGGHTSARWISKSKLRVNNFFIWGTGLPRDIDYKSNRDFWNKTNLKLIIGNKDQFINKEMLKEEIDYFQSQNINYELITYDGKHSINEYILTKIDKLI